MPSSEKDAREWGICVQGGGEPKWRVEGHAEQEGDRSHTVIGAWHLVLEAWDIVLSLGLGGGCGPGELPEIIDTQAGSQ